MGIAFAEEKNGDGTLTVKNKLAPFKLNIHKVNNKDKVLEGAEFTLYEDKDCSVEVDRQVSDKDGNVLEGVSVNIKSAEGAAEAVDKTAKTDALGNYKFKNIPLGKYKVTATNDKETKTVECYCKSNR